MVASLRRAAAAASGVEAARLAAEGRDLAGKRNRASLLPAVDDSFSHQTANRVAVSHPSQVVLQNRTHAQSVDLTVGVKLEYEEY